MVKALASLRSAISKLEALSPKQTPNSKVQMAQTFESRVFGIFDIV